MFNMFRMFPRGVYFNDGDDGDGKGGEGDGGGGGGADSDYEARIADFQSQLERAKGDAVKLAERLHTRAYGLRKRAQVAEAQLPGEGSVVLDKDAALVYDKLKNLGDPDEVAQNLADYALLKRGQEVSTVAVAAGYNPKVLSRILPEGAVIGIDDTEGSENPTPFILIDKKNVSLEEWVKNNRSEFIPALAADESGKRQWMKQKPSAGVTNSGGKDMVAARLKERDKARPEKPPF